MRRVAFLLGVAALLFTGGAAAAPMHRVLLGRSVDGRPIVAIELGDPASPRKVLVVGAIHGNEPAGIAIADLLISRPALAGVDLWVVPSFNPDGVAAGTRGNAHGVDLNRNFPWRWRPLSGVYYSGAHPLSEPESRIAYRLLERLRPAVSIWFHQHLDVVDESGGSVVVERRFAALVGLGVARLTREPGSIVSWENERLHGGTAFVVELPAGSLRPTVTDRFVRAIDAIAKP
jgi:murein peptide amidase A